MPVRGSIVIGVTGVLVDRAMLTTEVPTLQYLHIGPQNGGQHLSNVLDHARHSLVLHDQVRLEREGQPIVLRRKGLAVLAYLAVMGHGSRERLAALLWENGTSRANLRVELHRMSSLLGQPIFGVGEDPLRLPAWLGVDRGDGGRGFLLGLEGISNAYDRWLEGVRAHSSNQELQHRGAEALAADLARSLRTPFVVVVRGRPGDDLHDFTRALGTHMRMPVISGCSGDTRAVRVVGPPYPEGCVEQIVEDRDGGYVLEVPSYGEDPQALLELRNAYDPERLRFVEIPPIGWSDAREGLLRDLPFGQAARAYLLAAGNVGFLRELDQMGWPSLGPDDAPVIPQRIRASFQLEMRYASMDARIALEKLSVHPGALSEDLINLFDATVAIDELERRGWLSYEGSWRFRDPASRNVVYHCLQAGRRTGYHRQAAMQMAVQGDWLGEAYHRLAAGQEADWGSRQAPAGILGAAIDAWRGSPVQGDQGLAEPASVGPSLALLEERRDGPGIGERDGTWSIVRVDGGAPSAVVFELPDRPSVLRISGRAWADSPLGVGMDGTAFPLSLEFSTGSRFVFLQRLPEPIRRTEATLLPLSAEFEQWFVARGGGTARVSSQAETAVFELQLEVYATGSPTSGEASGVQSTVNAWPVASRAKSAR